MPHNYLPNYQAEGMIMGLFHRKPRSFYEDWTSRKLVTLPDDYIKHCDALTKSFVSLVMNTIGSLKFRIKSLEGVDVSIISKDDKSPILGLLEFDDPDNSCIQILVDHRGKPLKFVPTTNLKVKDGSKLASAFCTWTVEMCKLTDTYIHNDQMTKVLCHVDENGSTLECSGVKYRYDPIPMPESSSTFNSMFPLSFVRMKAKGIPGIGNKIKGKAPNFEDVHGPVLGDSMGNTYV